MALILDDLKRHLRVTHASDDVLLQNLLDAGVSHAERYLRADFAVDYPSGVPAPIETAIMSHASTMYLNPSATDDGDGTGLPQGWHDCLETYRNFT